jgi:hypothetical protein
MFGIYKKRKSPNPLNGVTKYVLILPLLMAIDVESGTSNINFKKNLESVFLKDLKRWDEDNLTENLAIKRQKILRAS